MQKEPDLVTSFEKAALADRIQSLEGTVEKLQSRQHDFEKSQTEQHLKQITIIFSCVTGLVAICAISITALGFLARSESTNAAKEAKESVAKEITDIERRFSMLAGDTLKKPALSILTRTGPLDGKTFNFSPGGLVKVDPLFIKNTGDKRTDPLSIRVYCPPGVQFNSGWARAETMDPDYSMSYYALGNVVAPGEQWTLEEQMNFVIGNEKETNTLCKLVVFFGGDKPAEAKFSFKATK